jgi:hypothetical protein
MADVRPELTLESIVAEMRRRPRTVELELALQDFLELPIEQKMEILFIGLCEISGRSDWCIAAIKQLRGDS